MIEMARVLIAAGQPVGQMAAIDYDLRLPGPPPTTLQAVAAFSANLPRWVQDDAIPSGARDLWGRVMSGLRRRLRRGRGPGDPNRPAVVDIRDRLGMWRFPDYSVGMLELHHRLIGDHVMTPIGAKVTLILARALPVLGPWPRGPHANWTRLAAGGLVVHDIKGSHSTMMSGPFAAGLAAILDKEIAAIERDQPAPQAPSTVRSSAS
jgi:thioesterase domain-containing protein